VIGAGLVHATEKDYLSNGASLNVSRELFDKNTSVSARAGFTANVVGKTGDPLYQAPLQDFSTDVGVTQVLSPESIAQLSITVARQQGQIASPYRKVAVAGGRFVLPEADPPVRDRLAAALGAKHAFGDLGVAHADYRLYWDTFGILSHTLDARWTFEWDRLALRLRYRLYTQNGASFYKSRYDAVQLYLSGDREMSPFVSHLFGAKLEWAPRREERRAQFRFDAKVEGMYFSYADFPALKTRSAIEVQLGAAVDF
jgi:hypothetical protein